MSLDEFRKQFEYLVDQEPPPLEMDAAGEAHGDGGSAAGHQPHE
jgi:hypothetical protein